MPRHTTPMGKAGGIARRPTTAKRTAASAPKTPIAMRGNAAATAPAGQYGKRAESKGYARGMANKAAAGTGAGSRGAANRSPKAKANVPATRAAKANYGKRATAKGYMKRGG